MIILELTNALVHRLTVPADFFLMTAAITVHEGEQEIISHSLEGTTSISWDMEVSEGYDIQFSVVIRSPSAKQKSSWIYFEPTRLTKYAGEITYTELQQDGIDLPVTIDFVLDNSYSWFSPKDVRLELCRCSSPPLPPSRPESATAIVSPSRDELERRRSLHGRERLDLLWLKHVITEAIDRCPESYEEVRHKLAEIRGILKYVED